VHPDVAKTLAIVAVRKPVLRSIRFDLYNTFTECCKFEDFWSCLIPYYSNYEDGEGGVCETSPCGVGRWAVICLTLMS
jgi:hypothetical protein